MQVYLYLWIKQDMYISVLSIEGRIVSLLPVKANVSDRYLSLTDDEGMM